MSSLCFPLLRRAPDSCTYRTIVIEAENPLRCLLGFDLSFVFSCLAPSLFAAFWGLTVDFNSLPWWPWVNWEDCGGGGSDDGSFSEERRCWERRLLRWLMIYMVAFHDALEVAELFQIQRQLLCHISSLFDATSTRLKVHTADGFWLGVIYIFCHGRFVSAIRVNYKCELQS